ncbi:hypothetical protein R1flu_027545 [Riccia fluitans]|uniref:Uncharacterized protein n=1 Tax=Riccia fluitans TaxID=41844 RepID=A0ABD1XJ51_9MARC
MGTFLFLCGEVSCTHAFFRYSITTSGVPDGWEEKQDWLCRGTTLLLYLETAGLDRLHVLQCASQALLSTAEVLLVILQEADDHSAHILVCNA